MNIEIYQFGSSLTSDSPNDVDIIIVSDLPVDICMYSKTEWDDFNTQGKSNNGRRMIVYPNKTKHLFERINKGEDLRIRRLR